MLSRRERYQIDVVKPSKQDATERVLNWNEVYQAYTPELAVIEAQRCLLCEHAPCMLADSDLVKSATNESAEKYVRALP